MKSMQQWLDEYGESHRNPTNKFIHWLCVPAITFSVLGLLWSLPVPAAMAEVSPWLNWATLFAVLAGLFYLRLSTTIFIGMGAVTAIMVYLCYAIAQSSSVLWQLSLAIFIVAWVGQFIGHKIEGKKPSFFKDLQFLLVGPAWLLAAVWRRLGIPF